MHLNALLDVDLVAHEAEDQVSLLLELAAPVGKSDRERPPATLQLVLDRSGSMGGGALEAAKQAIEALITRLEPTDNLGLPAGPLSDKDATRQLVRSVQPGGMTNLSSGYLRGLQEARRVKGDRGATLVLLSDGHANQGVTDHGRLGRTAATAHTHGVLTSTIGIGLGYDELLLETISRHGTGNHQFAEQGDAAGAALAGEVDGLLEQVVQAATLTVRPSDAVELVELYNDLAAAPAEGGFQIELGDFYAGETRKLLLKMSVPAMAALGLAQICELELTWNDADTLDTHTVKMPVSVNVVPGDEAAGRIPRPEVITEHAFQEAQRAKRDAVDKLRSGDVTGAKTDYLRVADALDSLDLSPISPAAAAEISAEAGLLRQFASEAELDAAANVKRSTADRYGKQRRRGPR